MPTTAERITQIIAFQLGVKASEVLPESRLEDDLGADSLDAVEIVLELEAEFDIDISDDEMSALQTVQQVTDLVRRLAA